MAALSNAFETALLNHLFLNAAVANLGDASGLQPSATAGSLYFALHTADPGEAGNQSTSECAYTGYARVAVARSGAGFTVSGGSVSPAADVTFGKNTGSSETATFWSVGVSSSGAGLLLARGPLATTAASSVFTAKTDDTLTVPGVVLVVNDRVTVAPLEPDSLPSGLSIGTVYFVKTVSGSDITLSTTSGGSVVDVTAAGGGLLMKVVPLVIDTNDRPILESTTTISIG